MIERGKGISIANKNAILISLSFSLIYHLLLFFVFANRCSYGLIEFWGFFVSDTFLAGMVLIPVVAIWLHQLKWYDPFSLLSLTFFGMIGTFYPAYLMDSEFVTIFSSYGSSTLQFSSEAAFLLLAIQAEMILGAFWTLIMLTNRKVPKTRTCKFSRNECKAALWTTCFFLMCGTAAFLLYWRTAGSFLYAVTVSAGKAVSTPELGLSRYLILIFIAVISTSLGIVGWLSLTRSAKRPLSDKVVLWGGGAGILVNTWNGARSDVLFTFLTILVVLKLFGFRIKKVTWLIFGTLAVGIIGMMTIIRGNPVLADNPRDVISQLISGEASYGARADSDLRIMLGLDRISVTIMLLAYLNTAKDFLYGESLIAGPVNIVADWTSRITGDKQIGEYSRGVLPMANETITFWRYGSAAYGGVPPSIPGEFYMQYGILSLLVLSALFGLILNWIRKKIASTRSLMGRWFFIIIAINIIKLVSAEVSIFPSVFLYYIFPIIIVHWIIFAFLRASIHKNKERSCATLISP